MILEKYNGFALKRIVRLEETISKRLELAREDKNLNGKAMAFLLKDKYGIDIQKEVSNGIADAVQRPDFLQHQQNAEYISQRVVVQAQLTGRQQERCDPR